MRCLIPSTPVIAQHRESAAEFLELLTAQGGFGIRLAGHDRILSSSPCVRHRFFSLLLASDRSDVLSPDSIAWL